VTIAEQQGYVSPAAAEALRAQAARTQADLDELRRQSPDWAAEIDRAIRAFNDSDVEAARAAFAEIDRLIAERVEELRAEQARSKHAQATLLYPFQFSKSEPLLCDAADLADTNIWYWIECGRARLAIGSLARAEAAFQTARDLAESEDNGDRYDLGIANEALGDVRVAQGNLSAALEAFLARHSSIKELAAADPGNAGWQRDLSVSWERIGDVRVAQGDLAGALDAYAACHAIAEKLAAADPGNAGWQRDLSVSWNRIGDVRVAQGDLAGALDAYTARHAIAEKLAAADPGNAEWQRDLIVSHWRIADVAETSGDAEKARENFEAALAITRSLAAAGRLAPVDAYFTEALEQRLAALDK
jgi:tetratricopeptide (TPR) repeat protein